MTDRNQRIVARYHEGYSLADVGAEFGITRERVRQILVMQGVTQRHYGSLKRDTLNVMVEAAYERILSGVSTITEEAEKLEIKPDSLRWQFRNRSWPLPPRKAAEHGTRWYYKRYRCRCDDCRAANRRYMASLRGKEPRQHGTYSAYQNYGCRCDACRIAAVHYRHQTKLKILSSERSTHV